jgi:ABC-type Fe3+-hydroxamate transport system substrate-binding protein
MGRILLAVALGIAAAVPAALTAGATGAGAGGGVCARRVVSLAPHATQCLFAVGAGSTVVGVDDYSREPAEALDRPRLGSYIDPDLEGIVGLRPDLVVLAATHVVVAEQLDALGLRTRLVPDTRMEDVFATLTAIGEVVCRSTAAAAVTTTLRDEIADAGRDAVGRPPLRAVLVVDRPAGDLRQFYVVGPSNFLDDVLRAAGAANVFESAPHAFPQVSLEPIVSADPDLILELVPGLDPQAAAARADTWRRVAPGLRAVREGRVVALPERWLPVPGPTVARAVRRMAELVAEARRAMEEGR